MQRDSLDIFEMFKSVTNVQAVAYREGFKAGMQAAFRGGCLCVHCGEPVPATALFRSIYDPCRQAPDAEPEEAGEARDFPEPTT